MDSGIRSYLLSSDTSDAIDDLPSVGVLPSAVGAV